MYITNITYKDGKPDTFEVECEKCKHQMMLSADNFTLDEGCVKFAKTDKDYYYNIINDYKIKCQCGNIHDGWDYVDHNQILRKEKFEHLRAFDAEVDRQVQANREINTPKCPTCGSTNIQKISTLDRVGSVGLFGIFGNKINKGFKCNNCKNTW